jgi:nicotinate-nucleotide--dimethylbenzimidazole phosphoribosyltransferase
MIDGVPACAALMLAARIAPAVTDYCMFCRSHGHRGLDQALNLFRASALLELGMESTDGTGATLAWPLVKSAAALLTEVADGEEPGPTRPGDLVDVGDAEPFEPEIEPKPHPFGDALY